MDLVGVTEARKDLALLLNRVESGESEGIYLVRHSQRAGVLLGPDQFDQMLAAQERVEALEDALMVTFSDATDTGERISLSELDRKYPVEG